MATSGSVNFSLNARGVINEATTLIGLRNEGMVALPDYDAEECLRALNLLLKTWSVKLRQWLQTEGTITPLLATAAYTLTPKAYTVESIRRRRSGIDTPLIAISRQDYFEQPNKSSTGAPNSFYYDPQDATGTIYLWPTPDADFAANGSLLYTYTRQIQDADSLNNDLDIPQEWFEALCYSLADRLVIRYPMGDPQRRADIQQRAAILYQGLTDFDQEDTSVFFQPGMS